MKENNDRDCQISLFPGPVWPSELLICSLFIAFFNTSCETSSWKTGKLLRRKTNVCNLCSSQKSTGQFTLQLLVFHFKLSAMAAGLSCHSLRFRLILLKSPFSSICPMAGLWSKLSLLSFSTLSCCFHFFNSQVYYKYFLFGTKMLDSFSDGNWEHLSPHS